MAPLDLESTMPDAAAVAAKAQEVTSCQAVVTLPSFLPATQVLVSSAPSTVVLDQVANELSQLREDLLSADPRLVAGRLELASGWARSAASIRAVLSQAVSSSDEEKRAANQARPLATLPWATLQLPRAAARRSRPSCKACATSSPRRCTAARRRRRR